MLLKVENLKTYFHMGASQIAKAVNGVSFHLEKGKTLALVGESGCGKTQTAFSIIRLIAENGYHPAGRILFQEKNLMSCSEEAMREIRGNDIGMIFQEPMTSLNPLYRIGNQLEEPLRLHKNFTKKLARQKVLEVLRRVGIPDPDKRINNFPHELSGGMKQRVMIAMALACEPKLLIADEPTTALDVTIQAQVLSLMTDLQKQTGMAILLITHDLGIVNQMADDICILYAGKVAEEGRRELILNQPAHPYTIKLLQSIPKPGDESYYLNTIPGMVPSASNYGTGCLFMDRCEQALESCSNQESPLHKIEPSHKVACHLIDNLQSFKSIVDKKQTAPIRKVDDKTLISIRNIKTWFPIRRGVFRKITAHLKAVDGVCLELKRGSTLGLVGESGCGKTTLGESILYLNREVKGEIIYRDTNILSLSGKKLKSLRSHLQAVFQDPFGALSPRMKVIEIIGEGLSVHNPKLNPREIRKQIENILVEVGLPVQSIDRYPHEFSGGQRQRISIARALILRPEFIMLDEPTSALDVSVQAQVLNLLRELQFKYKLTYLFITHNLAAARYLADTLAIMYLGRIVEQASAKQLFNNPRHPYTKSLLNAVPSLKERKPFENHFGDVPSPTNPPNGCHFHPRCPVYLAEPENSALKKKCHSEYPKKNTNITDFYVRCHAVIS